MSKNACKDPESQVINDWYLSGPKGKPQGFTILHDEASIVAFTLSIYGLVIFPGMLGYIKMAVVDTFKQIQHDNNPSLAILAETFQSLNHCCRN